VPPTGGEVGGPDRRPTGPLTPRRARAHVFVADLDDPVLADGDRHHLARVLRLPPGAAVTVGDGDGRWRAGVLTDGSRVEVAGDIAAEPPPEPPVTVAFALIKGGRPELTVQKLTEVGVDRIVPFVADRGVVRWDAAKAERHTERLAAIARGAAMQCRRTRLPRIEGLGTFPEVARLPGATLADLDGDPPVLTRPTILVGPEGGWSEAELATDLPTTRLGIHVFRAETAAITAGALMVALRENLVGYAP
jgi:16S rRNA (uracil1498-N3)-methyltransferase